MNKKKKAIFYANGILSKAKIIVNRRINHSIRGRRERRTNYTKKGVCGCKKKKEKE